MKKELVFGSFGLYPEQITLETVSALQKCGKVYLTCVKPGREKLLLSLFPGAELVSATAFEGLIRKVMETFHKFERVGVLDYGDPSFLCFFSERLSRECGKRQIRFKKCHAVSSLNSLISDLGLGDLKPGGLYLASVHFWKVPSRFINPAVPVLLFCPDRFYLDGDPNGVLAQLVKDVQRVYPSDHYLYFAGCRDASGKKRMRKVKIARLDSSLSGLKFDTTIYIPAVGKKRA